jgi:hypothetical protein
VKYLLALLGLLAVAATATVPNTAFDGWPPRQYQRPVTTTVIFANFPDIPKLCHYAPLPPSQGQYEGCTLANGTLVVPNPFNGAFAGERFARIVGHEIGHMNGWPGNHPDENGYPQGKVIR